MFNEEEIIEPIDTCGCGDIGYLTARRIPIDLVHGVGHVDNVPVYHCRTNSCHEFRLPSVVSRRLDTIAEQMEDEQITETIFTWETKQNPVKNSHPGPSLSAQPNNDQISLQAFTLQFVNRQYEDARVVQIVPGQAIIFQSLLEDTEYYLLRYEEADNRTEGIWFSLSKFYYEQPDLTYEDFLEWSEDGHLKELGRIPLNEVEDSLIDEFGEWS